MVFDCLLICTAHVKVCCSDLQSKTNMKITSRGAMICSKNVSIIGSALSVCLTAKSTSIFHITLLPIGPGQLLCFTGLRSIKNTKTNVK